MSGYRLIAAQFVTPFRKRRSTKNDRNDAEAIATAARQGKVLAAIANKHARQRWAMLARGELYDADAWLKHPMLQRPASTRRKVAGAPG